MQINSEHFTIIVKERCTHYVMHMYIRMNMHGSYNNNKGGVAYDYDILT